MLVFIAANENPKFMFWWGYMQTVHTLMLFTGAQRDRIWDLHFYVFHRMLLYFMHYSHVNYARWEPSTWTRCTSFHKRSRRSLKLAWQLCCQVLLTAFLPRGLDRSAVRSRTRVRSNLAILATRERHHRYNKGHFSCQQMGSSFYLRSQVKMLTAEVVFVFLATHNDYPQWNNEKQKEAGFKKWRCIAHCLTEIWPLHS